MKFIFFAILIISIISFTNGDLNSATQKMVDAINKAALEERNIDTKNSKYLNPAMNQLAVEFINPYNKTSNTLGLAERIEKGLRNGVTTCEEARSLSFSIQERGDYFYNSLSSSQPRDAQTCPITIPFIQREHEYAMAILLNRLQTYVLRAKKCQPEPFQQSRLAFSLKPISTDRFGQQGEEIESCKPKSEAIGSSCVETGVLKAGAGEVITGLRLRKDKNTIVPEIQVAKVTLFGLIDRTNQKWVGPSKKSKASCLPVKDLVGVKPVRLPQSKGNVLTQLQLMAKTKKSLQVKGNKLNYMTGKLEKQQKGAKVEALPLKNAESIDTEPVFVTTTVAGAGMKYDAATKTISPVLIAQNIGKELLV